jgi:hypothetical protein
LLGDFGSDFGGERVGSRIFKEEIFGRVRLKAHCFGHIHESNGAVESDGFRSFNSAICDMKYKPRQGWNWFDLPMGDLEPNDSKLKKIRYNLRGLGV